MKRIALSLLALVSISTTSLILSSILLPIKVDALPKWWPKLRKLINDIMDIIETFSGLYNDIKNAGGTKMIDVKINQSTDAYQEAKENGIILTRNSIEFPFDFIVASENNKTISIRKGKYTISPNGIASLEFLAK